MKGCIGIPVDRNHLNIFPKIKRTSGPAANSCQKNAIGKFLTVVEIQMLKNSGCRPFLNKMVAIRLMYGHIIQTDKTDIIRITKMILSSAGLKIRKVIFFAIGPTTKKSNKKANGHMIGSS